MQKQPTPEMIEEALTTAIGDVEPLPELFSTMQAILHLTRYLPTDPDMPDIIHLLKRDYDFYSNLAALMEAEESEK